MMTSPEVKRSRQSPSPKSHARHWAARLVLLGACAASVATSRSEPYVSQEHQGTPLTLRADAPPTSLRLRVRVSAQRPIEHSLHMFLQASLLATWRPDAPTSAPGPGLRARMVATPAHEDGPPWQVQFDLQGPDGGLRDEFTLYPSTTGFMDCKSKRECEWSVELQLEVEPNGAKGVIDLKSHFAGNVQFEGASTLPANARMEITEE